MTTFFSTRRRSLRRHPLALGVALILVGLDVPDASCAVTHVVTSCSEPLVEPSCQQPDDGTLRHAFFCAGNTDTIDLTGLQCSVITLDRALTDGAPYLTLKGPGKDLLRIDGAGKGRVLVHNGSGVLTIADQHEVKRIIGAAADIGAFEFVDKVFGGDFDPGPIARSPAHEP